MLCFETRLIFCLLECVIYGLEPLVVGDVFDKRLDFPQSRFDAFQFLAGAVIGAVNVLDLLFKIGVLEQVVFREIIECPRRFLEDRELGFILIALAVDKTDPLLNISDERDALRHGLPPVSARRPSGNPLLDAFLGVVLSDGLRTSKPLLTFSAEGDVFAGLNFITAFLHKPQKIIVVLGCDDKPVDGLLELLLPARAAFGFGVLLVAHALVLRGREYFAPRAKKFAMEYKDEPVIYVMGGGPTDGMAYAFEICSLIETQWMHAVKINTGEYFHGPFETTDKNLAIVLLMNDGRTRPVDERVMNFIQKYAERYSIIDAKDMGVNLFPDSVSEFFNPIAIYPALSQIVAELAIIRQHDKTVRRYMWNHVEY